MTFHFWKREMSSSKVKYHRKFFIETPKFVVLRGFRKSRNEAPQGLLDPLTWYLGAFVI